MDKYVKTVIETAITHTEYRESTTITLRDVLESFKVLGRPVYWNSEIAEMDDESEQIDGGNHFICLTHSNNFEHHNKALLIFFALLFFRR
jgi:hypothetical protein